MLSWLSRNNMDRLKNTILSRIVFLNECEPLKKRKREKEN